MVEAPAIPAARVAAPAKKAVRALARAEGRRLLRHPIFLVGVGGSMATFVIVTWSTAPVLQYDDILTGMALLPLAAATFLVVNLATTRSRRNGTDELYGSVPVGPAERTLGHLASVAWAVLVGCALVLLMLLYRLPQHPVGAPDLLELLVGPAVVAFMGGAAVAAGRWWPQAASGPVLLVAVAGIQIYLQFQLSASGTGAGKPGRWLSLWVPISVSGAPARELVIRPAAWHLLYAVALAAVIGLLAMARHGLTPRLTGIFGGVLVVMVLAAVVEVRPPTTAERDSIAMLLRVPERFQVCRIRGGVRYCAFPQYAPWIDRWADAIQPVLDRVPASSRPPGLEVRQTLVLWGSDVEGLNFPPANTGGQTSYTDKDDLGTAIRPTSQWGRRNVEGDDQLQLAGIVAAMAVGLPRRPQDIHLTSQDIKGLASTMDPSQRSDFIAMTKPGDPWYNCRVTDQARAVVALWLAAQATPGAGGSFRRAIRVSEHLNSQGPLTSVGPYFYMSSPIPTSYSPVNWDTTEAAYAAQLLDRPVASVAAQIRQNWDLLTDRRTTSARLAGMFGLKPLPSLAQRAEEFDPSSILCP